MWIIELDTTFQYLQVIQKIHAKMQEKIGDELKQDRWMLPVPPLTKAGKPFVILPQFMWKNENIREWILQHLDNLPVKQVSKDDENYFPKPVLPDLLSDPNYVWNNKISGENKQKIIDFIKERKPDLLA